MDEFVETLYYIWKKDTLFLGKDGSGMLGICIFIRLK